MVTTVMLSLLVFLVAATAQQQPPRAPMSMRNGKR